MSGGGAEGALDLPVKPPALKPMRYWYSGRSRWFGVALFGMISALTARSQLRVESA
jgi:hypothetical protein